MVKQLVQVDTVTDLMALEAIASLVAQADIDYFPYRDEEELVKHAAKRFRKNGAQTRVLDEHRLQVETKTHVYETTVHGFILARSRFRLASELGFLLEQPTGFAASA